MVSWGNGRCVVERDELDAADVLGAGGALVCLGFGGGCVVLGSTGGGGLADGVYAGARDGTSMALSAITTVAVPCHGSSSGSLMASERWWPRRARSCQNFSTTVAWSRSGGPVVWTVRISPMPRAKYLFSPGAVGSSRSESLVTSRFVTPR